MQVTYIEGDVLSIAVSFFKLPADVSEHQTQVGGGGRDPNGPENDDWRAPREGRGQFESDGECLESVNVHFQSVRVHLERERVHLQKWEYTYRVWEYT